MRTKLLKDALNEYFKITFIYIILLFIFSPKKINENLNNNNNKKSEYKAGYRENPDLDLFGYWQTQVYEPPRAYGGKVPRNDFGNVELFLPSMLPLGCVHLRLPNLNRICRKLNVDCVAAVVGFDAHGGFSHAVYDGWVVCEEHKEAVIAAHEEEERRANLKLVQMHQERIWSNWRKLCKGLLIREKLKLKYASIGLSSLQPEVAKQKKQEETKIEYTEADEAIKKLTKSRKKKMPSEEDVLNAKRALNEWHETREESEDEEEEVVTKKKKTTSKKKPVLLTQTKTKSSYPKRQTRNKNPVKDDNQAENDENDGEDESFHHDDNEDEDDDDFEAIVKKRRSNVAPVKQVVKRVKRFEFDLSNDSSPASNDKKETNKVDHDDLNLSEEDE